KRLGARGLFPVEQRFEELALPFPEARLRLASCFANALLGSGGVPFNQSRVEGIFFALGNAAILECLHQQAGWILQRAAQRDEPVDVQSLPLVGEREQVIAVNRARRHSFEFWPQIRSELVILDRGGKFRNLVGQFDGSASFAEQGSSAL